MGGCDAHYDEPQDKQKSNTAEAGAWYRLPVSRPQSEGRDEKRLMILYLNEKLKSLKRKFGRIFSYKIYIKLCKAAYATKDTLF